MSDTTTLNPAVSEPAGAGSPLATPTVAHLLDRLGVGPERVLMQPLPGTATETDVVALNDRTNQLAELVDGTLVEKAMGIQESHVAGLLLTLLNNWLRTNRIGKAFGADGLARIAPGLVRIPDVSFVSTSRLPGGRVPTQPILGLAPDLAVEVVSRGNTRKEMARKLDEYFSSGVKLVWLIYPSRRALHVFTSVDQVTVIDGQGSVEAGDVLPGFSFILSEIFDPDVVPDESDD